MDFISIILSGVVSLCVSIAVNVILDAIRKRSANREKATELSLNFLQELTSNYKKVQKGQKVETIAIREMISFTALNPDIRRALGSLIDLFDSYTERVSAGRDVVDLGIERAMLNVYANPFFSNGIKVGIIYSPRFRHPSEGVCGHWGIAPPDFFKGQLGNFLCCYVSPSSYERISEFDIVINPYGEAWVIKDCQENTIFRALKALKEFILKGGIWVHTGGFPFYFACDPSGKIRVKVAAEVWESLGISFEKAPELEIPRLTEEAKRLLGDVDLPRRVGGYRVCTAEREWIQVAGKALMGFKEIGEGGILFQGGLYYPLPGKELPLAYYMIKCINLLCLEGKVYRRAP